MSEPVFFRIKSNHDYDFCLSACCPPGITVKEFKNSIQDLSGTFRGVDFELLNEDDVDLNENDLIGDHAHETLHINPLGEVNPTKESLGINCAAS